MRRKHIVSWVAVVMVFIGAGQQLLTDKIEANAQSATRAPKFVMEPGWLKAPTKWTLGYLSSVSVDQDDHVWILQRPQGDDLWPLEDRGRIGPPVMEFDVDGNFVQGGEVQGPDTNGRSASTGFTWTIRKRVDRRQLLRWQTIPWPHARVR